MVVVIVALDGGTFIPKRVAIGEFATFFVTRMRKNAGSYPRQRRPEEGEDRVDRRPREEARELEGAPD